MSSKRNKLLKNPTIIVALIGLCGTLAAALLSSPVVLELMQEWRATPTSTATSTPFPTVTPGPTGTPSLTPTPLLPDLEVLAISSPTCVSDHRSGSTQKYVRQTITIRNIGAGSTSAFGPFSSRVTFIFGGQRYSLEDWSTRYNGIIGTPELNVADLGPNQDADLTLNIDLRGNKAYGIEVVANSGAQTIAEGNLANNSLTQNFTTNCP